MARYPNPMDYFNNFRRSDLPFAKKVALSIKNNGIKLRNRSDCCGNHGEPGC